MDSVSPIRHNEAVSRATKRKRAVRRNRCKCWLCNPVERMQVFQRAKKRVGRVDIADGLDEHETFGNAPPWLDPDDPSDRPMARWPPIVKMPGGGATCCEWWPVSSALYR